MNKTAIKEEARRLVFMIIGCLISALAVNLFLAPNSIVTGGTTGLGTVANKLFNLPIGSVIFALNLPILFFGYKMMGRTFIIRCLVTNITLSIFIDTLSFLPRFTDDRLISAIYGGALFGISVGLFYMNSISSGGSELLARILIRKFRAISISKMLAIIDAVVVVIGAIALKDPENVLYASILIFVTAKVSDGVISGFNYAKVCFIITEKQEEVAKVLLAHSRRGVTSMDGIGMYSKTRRNVLITVVKKPELPKLKGWIAEADPDAFVVVSEAQEVLGLGFKSIIEE